MGDASDMVGKPTGAARRFAAFISYSHADADAAAKLQRRLERYRLPKRIAETRTTQTTALGPIFRDREDFAAAASLSEAIRDAIARAEALIVICSPDAAASRWVAAEIDLFRKLHPQRPILAAILSGEPATAFPPALTVNGNEPLAADLRPEGDGTKLGFLKIVAGIAGVPLDSLIQRDAQRRMRRVTAITGAALAAMLIMGIMTTLAIQARNEAARQRAAAEGLVEYMLTDLREKLRGVNRLDVLSSVNNRAMEHYQAQGDLTKLPADSLERRARILHAMGEDEERRGDIDGAASKFVEAHRTTTALVSQAPNNPDRIFAHAQSEYWVGYAAWRKMDSATAEKYWRGYLAQAQRLARAEPRTVRSYMELGYAHGNMCEILMNKQRDVDRGLKHCRLSIAFEREALRLEPGNVTNGMALANRLGWMADALVGIDDLDKAIEYRQVEQRQIDALLARNPRNVELRVRQTWPQIGIGKIAESRGETDKAAATLKRALSRLDAIAIDFPDDFLTLEYRIRTNIIIARNYRTAARAEWKVYRDKAAMLIADAKNANEDGLPRMNAMLAKFDGEK
jgi:tetratricopeptide (TPR) repeat protein